VKNEDCHGVAESEAGLVTFFITFVSNYALALVRANPKAETQARGNNERFVV